MTRSRVKERSEKCGDHARETHITVNHFREPLRSAGILNPVIKSSKKHIAIVMDYMYVYGTKVFPEVGGLLP